MPSLAEAIAICADGLREPIERIEAIAAELAAHDIIPADPEDFVDAEQVAAIVLGAMVRPGAGEPLILAIRRYALLESCVGQSFISALGALLSSYLFGALERGKPSDLQQLLACAEISIVDGANVARIAHHAGDGDSTESYFTAERGQGFDPAAGKEIRSSVTVSGGALARIAFRLRPTVEYATVPATFKVAS